MNITPTHPRIWLTPDNLAVLKARAAANDPRWNTLKSTVDAYTTPSWDVGVMNYALVYQITGDQSYAQKAISLMWQSMSSGLGQVTGDNGYQCRNYFPTATIVYDWLYSVLTPTQRQQLQSDIETCADWVWPETNPSRIGAWGVNDPGSNYFHGFMFTWMAGLAMYGDSAKASGYINNAVTRWNSLVIPYMSTGGSGGYLLDGTNYGTDSIGYMLWYLLAHMTSTGEDLINSPSFTWMKDAMTCMLHITSPTRDRKYPGGDQAKNSGAPLMDNDRRVGLVSLSTISDRTAGYCRYWLDNINPSTSLQRASAWVEFLWYNNGVVPIDYTVDLPTYRLCPGAGLFSCRSGWGKSDIQVVVTCGPQLSSHQDRAANMFAVFKGDWIVGLAKINSNSGLVQDTASSNALVFGGRGQYSTPSELARYAPTLAAQQPKIVKAISTSGCSYFVGDATCSYYYFVWPNAVQPLSKYLRHILVINDNLVILLDQYTLTNPGITRQSPLNFLTTPKVSGSQFEATVGPTKLFGQVHLPSNAQLVVSPFSESPTTPPTSWRVDTFVPSGSFVGEEYILTTMELVPSNTTSRTTVSVTNRGTIFDISFGGSTYSIDYVGTNAYVNGQLLTSSGSVSPKPPPPSGNDPTSGIVAALTAQLVAATGQIVILQNQISSLSGQIVNLSSQVATLAAANTTLSATNATLSAQVGSLTNANINLNNIIAKVKADLGM